MSVPFSLFFKFPLDSVCRSATLIWKLQAPEICAYYVRSDKLHTFLFLYSESRDI